MIEQSKRNIFMLKQGTYIDFNVKSNDKDTKF